MVLKNSTRAELRETWGGFIRTAHSDRGDIAKNTNKLPDPPTRFR